MLSDEQYTTVQMPTFADYLKTNETYIDLLVLRMARKGIQMTELEAYQYLCWCQRSLLDNMMRLSDRKGAEAIKYLTEQISDAAKAHFQGFKTGKLADPTGPRFEDPLDHQRKTRGVAATPEVDPPNKFNGYL